jgi:mercuric ion binding protein
VKYLLAPLALLAVVVPAWAAPQTVTLSVPGMTCAACPITVKRALSRVSGVDKIDVSLEKKEAVVTFDDTKTSVAALTKATENAGYPSSVQTVAARQRAP